MNINVVEGCFLMLILELLFYAIGTFSERREYFLFGHGIAVFITALISLLSDSLGLGLIAVLLCTMLFLGDAFVMSNIVPHHKKVT